ncbi:MAG: DUF1552 domain-containing protein [Pirellulales bacterium]
MVARRSFLRCGAVAIALPLFDAWLPRGLRADSQSASLQRKRLLLIGRPLGLHASHLFPEQTGRDYQPTRYLAPLADLRNDFTLFSGMSHLGYGGGHQTEVALMTGVGAEGMRDRNSLKNTISLDQEVAPRLGTDTRFASLVLGGGELSWNRQGVKVPSDDSIANVFRKLFIDGSPQETEREIQHIAQGHSILDGVREQARSLARSLPPSDQQRLELLLTSIREAEQRLQQDEAWVRRPKPRLNADQTARFADPPRRMLDREQQWFDLVHLALLTDSTRVISLYLYSHAENLLMEGITLTHHDASHHGQDENKLRQLAVIEEAEMRLFAELLTKLKQTQLAGASLLDQTVVLHTSNLGNASSHATDNLPVLLAGGGFRHAGHVAGDRRANTPLSNLFVRMLRQLDIPLDRFGSSTSTVDQI